jgi:hypothetical protein
MGQPMKEKKRTRGIHTAVVLPRDVLEQLRRSERGVSEEIRRRIALTFEQDSIDPVTRELRDGLVDIAKLLRQDYAVEWYTWPPAYQAFAAAMAKRIAEYAPPPGILASAGATKDMLREESPETIGRMRERDDRRAHAYKHLAEAQKRRSAGFTKHVKKGDTK